MNFINITNHIFDFSSLKLIYVSFFSLTITEVLNCFPTSVIIEILQLIIAVITIFYISLKTIVIILDLKNRNK